MSFNGASFFSDRPSTPSFFQTNRRSRTGSRDSRSSEHERAKFHELASHSTEYTTFPELNLPPSPPPSAENKGFVSEIQEGLSGFCSRLIRGKIEQNIGDKRVEHSQQQSHEPKTPIARNDERTPNPIREGSQPDAEAKGTPKPRLASDVSSDSLYHLSPSHLRNPSSSSANVPTVRESPKPLSTKDNDSRRSKHSRNKSSVSTTHQTDQKEQLPSGPRTPAKFPTLNANGSDPMLTTSNGVQSPTDRHRGSHDEVKICVDGHYPTTTPIKAKPTDDAQHHSAADDQIRAQRTPGLIEQVLGFGPLSKPAGVTDQPRRLLHEEYWMKDANANDCFLCGAHFSPWRRKHHCRTCGQVLCSKCTSKISGATFGQDDLVLVCKKCEQRIYDSEYDSSDYYSNDEGMSPVLEKPGASDRLSNVPSSVATTQHKYDNNPNLKASISMDRIASSRRLTESSHRRSTTLDSDNNMVGMPRPTSSRSGKSASNGRSHSLHRPHQSRPKVVRNFKPDRNDRPPFQYRAGDDFKSKVPFSVSVIDQDLAEYMSVDDPSERRP